MRSLRASLTESKAESSSATLSVSSGVGPSRTLLMVPSAKTTSFSSATRSAPVNTSLSKLGENPESICVFGVFACTGKPTVSPRRFQKMMRGAAYGSPHTRTPTSEKRRCNRSKCVSHLHVRPIRIASSNCISLNTIRSGISSGFSFADSAASRMSWHAVSKSVLPPHGARCTRLTFSAIVRASERLTHRGEVSKVRIRSRKAECVISETRMPSPMATCIGVPLIDPDTSTSGTSLPRSTFLGIAALRAPRSSRPTPVADDTRTSRSACSRARSRVCWTPSRIDNH
mmetsp:Transcript_40431/g.86221  ORF Transcript_40431/g.86221 Transcript_40431/m.86221 type:complete len:286 (+) Transcript_40431:281-1138(+)